MANLQRTALPVIAGIFTIISASILLAISLIGLSLLLLYPTQYISYMPIFANQLMHIAIILCIGVIGLVGGIMSLMRSQFVLGLIGTSFMLLTGINAVAGNITLLGYQFDSFDNLLSSLMIFLGNGTVFVFSLLSIIFLSKSKNEFS